MAFEAVTADIAQLGDIDLATPNVDVMSATRNLLVTSANIERYLPKLDAFAAVALDVDAVRKLRERAHALGFAHARCAWRMPGDQHSIAVRDAIWVLALRSFRATERWIRYLRFDEGDADAIVRSPWQTKKRRVSK